MAMNPDLYKAVRSILNNSVFSHRQMNRTDDRSIFEVIDDRSGWRWNVQIEDWHPTHSPTYGRGYRLFTIWHRLDKAAKPAKQGYFLLPEEVGLKP